MPSACCWVERFYDVAWFVLQQAFVSVKCHVSGLRPEHGFFAKLMQGHFRFIGRSGVCRISPECALVRTLKTLAK